MKQDFVDTGSTTKLLSYGINSIVVNPADIPTTDKERVQKEDKRDSPEDCPFIK